MADRTSAKVFGVIFKTLAKNPTDENKQTANEIFKKTIEYDFSSSQLESDEELIKLGLAKKGINPNYPEDGEIVFYQKNSV